MEVKPADLLGIALRAIAVWLVLYALSQVSAAVWVFEHDRSASTTEGYGLLVVGFGLPLIAAAALWAWAYPAAARLCGTSDGVIVLGLNSAELERVVLVGIGAYLLATRVASITYWFVFFRRQTSNDPFAPELHPDLLASICRSAVELVMGVWFVRGAPGLKRMRGESLLTQGAANDAQD